MSTDQWATVLAFVCFPAVNLFWFLYGLTAPWWRSWTGRAIITSKLGLAVLVDSAVIYRVNGKMPYPYQAQVAVVAFGLIALGTWLYLHAFLREQFLFFRHEPPGQDTP